MFTLNGYLTRRRAARVVNDSLDAFFTEESPAAAPKTGQQPTLSTPVIVALTLLSLVGAGLAGVFVKTGGLLNKRAEAAVPAPLASLTIESDPVGAEVSEDGVRRGVTPLTLTVTPGAHKFEITHAERRKQINVDARADAAVVHHVQFDLPSEPVTKKKSAPSATAATAAPVGATAGTTGPAAGWLSISSSIPLNIIEGGQIIGSTASSKIMVPAGKRELRLVNESIGFSERRTVQIGAGKTASLSVTLPKAPLSINAVPWAEVWVDGVSVGETPIGNHMVRVGAREIVFRHPTFGERRQSVVVSLTSPARVSVDMRKAP